MKIEKILGHDVYTDNVQGAAELALYYIQNPNGSHYMACLNPHSVVVAEDDKQFKDSLRSADILLPDGIGIVLAAKILGMRTFDRIAGMDFFEELSKRCNERGGIRYFFIGSTTEVLDKITSRMEHDYPNIRVCGVLSPPFKQVFSDEDNQNMLNAINGKDPHVLWVGMTAPKQEKWIYQNINTMNVPFTGAIGAVFDFYAGTKKRSPEWACKLGMEWLPRLLQEPRRLFRRNFVSTPLFLLLVLKSKLGLD